MCPWWSIRCRGCRVDVVRALSPPPAPRCLVDVGNHSNSGRFDSPLRMSESSQNPIFLTNTFGIEFGVGSARLTKQTSRLSFYGGLGLGPRIQSKIVPLDSPLMVSLILNHLCKATPAPQATIVIAALLQVSPSDARPVISHNTPTELTIMYVAK